MLTKTKMMLVAAALALTAPAAIAQNAVAEMAVEAPITVYARMAVYRSLCPNQTIPAAFDRAVLARVLDRSEVDRDEFTQSVTTYAIMIAEGYTKRGQIPMLCQYLEAEYEAAS